MSDGKSFLDKAKEFAENVGENISDGIDKAGDFIEDKLGGDAADKVKDAAGDAVDAAKDAAGDAADAAGDAADAATGAARDAVDSAKDTLGDATSGN